MHQAALRPTTFLPRTLAGALAGVGLVLAACQPAAPTAPAAQPTSAAKPAGAATSAPAAVSAPSGKLTIGIGSIPPSPDPHIDSTANSLPVYATMFEKLVMADEKTNPAGVLAESWNNTNDTTWEFRLRQGVTFHDGSPLTSEDVKFSIERVLKPETKSPWAGRVNEIDRVEVVDPLNFRIVTKRPFGPLIQGLMVVDIVPAKYLQARGDQGFADAPVGTGPFKFKDWLKQDHLTVAANTDYWGNKPKLAEVTFKSVPEASTRVAGLQSGDLDVSLLLPPEQAAPLKAAGINVDSVNQGQGQVINLRSTAGGPLADKKVRQALNYAVDKDSILKNLLLGYGKVLDGQIPGSDAFGYNPDLKPYPYDPAKAKQLLAEAGFPNGFELKFHGSQGRYTKDKEIEEAIVGQLAQVGVKADLEILESGVFISSYLAAQIGPAFIWAWQYLPAMDADLPLNFFASSLPQKLYNNPEYDQLLAKERASLKPEDRRKVLMDMNAFLHDDPPSIFLVQTPGLWGTTTKVQGFRWRPDYGMDLTAVSVSG